MQEISFIYPTLWVPWSYQISENSGTISTLITGKLGELEEVSGSTVLTHQAATERMEFWKLGDPAQTCRWKSSQDHSVAHKFSLNLTSFIGRTTRPQAPIFHVPEEAGMLEVGSESHGPSLLLLDSWGDIRRRGRRIEVGAPQALQRVTQEPSVQWGMFQLPREPVPPIQPRHLERSISDPLVFTF